MHIFIVSSIRVPAAFNGLYGLRPSSHRIPYRGAVNSLEGQDSIPSVLGPMSPSLLGIKVFMKAVIDAKPWLKDPMAMRKSWDQLGYELFEHGNGKRLVFGILWDDAHVAPHPPVLRALEMTRDALIAAGHRGSSRAPTSPDRTYTFINTVVDWKPHRHIDLCTVTRHIWRSGSREDCLNVARLTNEPIIDTMSPDVIDPINPEHPPFLPPASISAYELWQLHKEKRELREEYLTHWEATATVTGTNRPVDAIIAPVAPFAAPPHGKNL